MNRSWFLVAKREYLQRVRSRSYLVVTFLVPLIVALVLAIPARLSSVQQSRSFDVAVIDNTMTTFDVLRAELEASPWDHGGHLNLLETPLDLRREDLLAWVREGALDAMLVVMGDAGHAERAELVAASHTDSLMIGHLSMALSRATLLARLRHEGLASDRITELTQPLPLCVVSVRASGRRDPEAVFLIVLFMAMILYMTLLIYGMATMRSVVEERCTRIVEVLLASIKPADLLAGKISGVALVGLTQYLVWLALSSVASKGGVCHPAISSILNAGSDLQHVWMELLLPLVGFFVLGYLLYACLYALAGSLAGQPSDTQQLQFPITMMLLLPIVFLPLVLRMPDAPVTRAFSLVPFFSPILMFCRIAVSDFAVWEVIVAVALIVFAIGIAWRLSARVYRVTILMAGKRITFKEVARWIQHE
jgi:ABC-2 type transport system permease protein